MKNNAWAARGVIMKEDSSFEREKYKGEENGNYREETREKGRKTYTKQEKPATKRLTSKAPR
eukprot:393673-Pleurochrysis_carterae.AAC.1